MLTAFNYWENESNKMVISGIHSALFGIAITNGVYYYWYEMVKGLFIKASNRKMMSTPQSMLAGAIAGAATVLLTNPIWVINTRMTVKKDTLDEKNENRTIVSTKPSNSTWAVLMKMIQEDGVASLWQGLVPALILVINPIIQ
ncbi:hypothetical protein HMI56_005912, partial [Coelomomyces lativittatus]